MGKKAERDARRRAAAVELLHPKPKPKPAPRWSLTGSERRLCPPEYQEHLNRLGGLNRYGEPNFKLVWGQTHTDKYFGQKKDGSRGPHEVLMFHDIPAWHLLEWKPPEIFGGPDLWFAMTWDKATMLHGLGDYPKRGFYVSCPFRLYVRSVVDGRLVIDAMPLAFWLLDLIIPNIAKDRAMTLAQKKLAAREIAAKESKAWRDRVIDAYLDAQPAFGGQDFDRSVNRDRMVREIQARGFKVTAEEIKARLGTGHRARRLPGAVEAPIDLGQ